MLSAIYPVPASEVRLPFYLSGIGRHRPNFTLSVIRGLPRISFFILQKAVVF